MTDIEYLPHFQKPVGMKVEEWLYKWCTDGDTLKIIHFSDSYVTVIGLHNQRTNQMYIAHECNGTGIERAKEKEEVKR